MPTSFFTLRSKFCSAGPGIGGAVRFFAGEAGGKFLSARFSTCAAKWAAVFFFLHPFPGHAATFGWSLTFWKTWFGAVSLQGTPGPCSRPPSISSLTGSTSGSGCESVNREPPRFPKQPARCRSLRGPEHFKRMRAGPQLARTGWFFGGRGHAPDSRPAEGTGMGGMTSYPEGLRELNEGCSSCKLPDWLVDSRAREKAEKLRPVA